MIVGCIHDTQLHHMAVEIHVRALPKHPNDFFICQQSKVVMFRALDIAKFIHPCETQKIAKYLA